MANISFGERLRRARVRNAMTQGDLVEKIGVVQATISNWHSDNDLPAVAGIYVLYDISERPIYVGQGADIRARIRSHRDKFWFKQPIVHTAAYVKIEDKSLREKVETLLIRFLKSNAVINKQNVERE